MYPKEAAGNLLFYSSFLQLPSLFLRTAGIEPATVACPHMCPDGIAPVPLAKVGSRFLQAAAYGLEVSQWKRRVHPPLEGRAGFEPTASRCAAGMLPKALPAHIAATRAAFSTSQPFGILLLSYQQHYVCLLVSDQHSAGLVIH